MYMFTNCMCTWTRLVHLCLWPFHIPLCRFLNELEGKEELVTQTFPYLIIRSLSRGIVSNFITCRKGVVSRSIRSFSSVIFCTGQLIHCTCYCLSTSLVLAKTSCTVVDLCCCCCCLIFQTPRTKWRIIHTLYMQVLTACSVEVLVSNMDNSLSQNYT